MKKTLVALAAAAATGAFAQSSVSMYGLIDLNYGTTKTTGLNGAASRKTTGLGEGTTAGNRLGFRGTEDLGGGMKAGFVIETGFSAITSDIFGNRAGNQAHFNTNAGAAGGVHTASANSTTLTAAAQSAFRSETDQNRQSYVGLSGGFGEVRIGYQYTAFYTLSSLSGYLRSYEGNAGSDVAHLFGAGAVGGARANGLTYISPKFAGGFDAMVQYGGAGANPNMNGTSVADTDKAQRVGYMLNYANGPLKASVAYTSLKKDDVGAAGNSAGTGKMTQVGASYNFGVATVNGTYNNGKSGLTTSTDYKSHQIGVSVPFGAVSAFAAFGKSKQDQLDAGVLTAVEYKQQQFGAEYALSKRTMVYAVSGSTKLKSTGAASNAKGTSTRFGMRHTF